LVLSWSNKKSLKHLPMWRTAWILSPVKCKCLCALSRKPNPSFLVNVWKDNWTISPRNLKRKSRK
jgi:hypothetical protein